MRLSILLLIVGICMVSAKYLPDEWNNSGYILSRNRRSDSEESATSSEDENNSNSNDENDSSGNDDDNLPDQNAGKLQSKRIAKMELVRQKLMEKQEKERKKQEEAQRKLEEKIAKELQKEEEKHQKEERKREEKLEKERMKLEEEQRKIQEKIIENEHKRQERIQKQLEEIEEDTLKIQEIDDDLSESFADDSLELEDFWKIHIYAKYGITESNTDLEKKAALKRYLQDELGLNANSTESDRRQAVLHLIETKSQDVYGLNALQNQLIEYINFMGVQKIRGKLDKVIEELNNKTEILNNVNLTWVPIAKQNVAEQVSFLQTVKEFLSNILPNWYGESTHTSGSQVSSLEHNQENSTYKNEPFNVSLHSNNSVQETDSGSVIININDGKSEGNESNLSSSSPRNTNSKDNGVTTLSDNDVTPNGSSNTAHNPTSVSASLSNFAGNSSSDLEKNTASVTELRYPSNESSTVSETGIFMPKIISHADVTAAPVVTDSKYSASISTNLDNAITESSSGINILLDKAPSNDVINVDATNADVNMAFNPASTVNSNVNNEPNTSSAPVELENIASETGSTSRGFVNDNVDFNQNLGTSSDSSNVLNLSIDTTSESSQSSFKDAASIVSLPSSINYAVSSSLQSITDITAVTPSLVTDNNIESASNPLEIKSNASEGYKISDFNNDATQNISTNSSKSESEAIKIPVSSSVTQSSIVSEGAHIMNQTSITSESIISNTVQPSSDISNKEQQETVNEVTGASTEQSMIAELKNNITETTIQEISVTTAQSNVLVSDPTIEEISINNVPVPVESGASVIDTVKQ